MDPGMIARRASILWDELLLPHDPIYIVAGVDEVQLLNRKGIDDGSTRVGLGQLFLRILHQWQSEWYIKGIRLLPLGWALPLIGSQTQQKG